MPTSSAETVIPFGDIIVPTLFGTDALGEQSSPAAGTPNKAVRSQARSEAFLRERTAQAQARLAAKSTQDDPQQQVLALIHPKWDEARRGVPNPLVRSGLFTTRMGARRAEIRGARIASLSTVDVSYKGEELRQDDLSVWMAIVSLGRNKTVGDFLFFSAYQLIKDMNWRMHTDSYVKLKASIERLKFTSLTIGSRDGRKGYTGALIRDFSYDATDPDGPDGNARWCVRLEPAIVGLFAFNDTTLLEWDQRKRIGTRAALTLWLHTFYSSHREPIPYSVSKLHELCASENKAMTSFRAALRRSLETLVQIGFLRGYHITGDVVHVDRLPLQRALAA